MTAVNYWATLTVEILISCTIGGKWLLETMIMLFFTQIGRGLCCTWYGICQETLIYSQIRPVVLELWTINRQSQ